MLYASGHWTSRKTAVRKLLCNEGVMFRWVWGAKPDEFHDPIQLLHSLDIRSLEILRSYRPRWFVHVSRRHQWVK